ERRAGSYGERLRPDRPGREERRPVLRRQAGGVGRRGGAVRGAALPGRAGGAGRGLRRLRPDLAEAKVTHAWGGPIDASSDHLPFFGTVPGTRIHYGAGYSGNRVGPSWLGGHILARIALEGET